MKHVAGWLLLLPAATLLVAFTHYPAAATLAGSFFSTGTVVRPSRFVGVANYAALLDDPERRARMGTAGRQRVLERFSWHAVAVATAAAYEEVANKHADR